jgi:hypothetical protein
MSGISWHKNVKKELAHHKVRQVLQLVTTLGLGGPVTKVRRGLLGDFGSAYTLDQRDLRRQLMDTQDDAGNWRRYALTASVPQ